MNLSNSQEIKKILQHAGLKPKDYLGQNFLVDERVLDEIVEAADLKPSDTILEVGPGLGVLTTRLAESGGVVIAVEKDKKLIPLLRQSLKDFPKVKIIEQDILRFDLKKNLQGSYKVVANIPYYLTSHLFQYFLQSTHPPSEMILMVQEEVGERITAGPGELSLLGISVQMHADAEIILRVPKTAFWPEPEVDSCVLRMELKNKYPEITDQNIFFRILKAAFAGKRKQIHNTLATGLGLTKERVSEVLSETQVSPQARPQDLSIEDWVRLYHSLRSK